MVDKMHKYVAIFKVYDKYNNYSVFMKTEAFNKDDAVKYFNDYEYCNNLTFWKIIEVKTFKDLWELL